MHDRSAPLELDRIRRTCGVLLVTASLLVGEAAARPGPRPQAPDDGAAPEEIRLELRRSEAEAPSPWILLLAAPGREPNEIVPGLRDRGWSILVPDRPLEVGPASSEELARELRGALLRTISEAGSQGLAPDRWAVLGDGPGMLELAELLSAGLDPATTSRPGSVPSHPTSMPSALAFLDAEIEAAELSPSDDLSLPPMLFVEQRARVVAGIARRTALRQRGVELRTRVLGARDDAAAADAIDLFLANRLGPPRLDWALARPAAGTGLALRAAAIDKTLEDARGVRAIALPRFHNRVRRVILLDGAEQPELKLQPGLRSWNIAIPETLRREGPLTVRIETLERPELPTAARIVSPSGIRSITLPAHHALTHGRLLRYEPQPHKNTLGYWADAADWCEWHFLVEDRGSYAVEILQGCGAGQGGSRVQLRVGTQEIEFEVLDTGHFQNFVPRPLGELHLDPGLHTLQLRVLHKAKDAVMDVRRIDLVAD